MKTAIIQATKWLVTILPFKPAILKMGAALPVLFKTRRVLGGLSLLYHHCKNKPREFRTNLGVSNALKLRLPSLYSCVALFGKPIFYTGERGALFLCKELSRDAGCFFDIGAYEGYFSLVMAAWNHDKLPIYFVEADPDRYRMIKEVVSNSGFRNIQGIGAAIASEVGTATLFVNKDQPLTTSLLAGRTDGAVPTEVPTLTFDEIARSPEIHDALVKLDIEGAEIQFLAGGMGALTKVKHLVVEMLDVTLRSDFAEKMRAQGFHSYYICDFKLLPVFGKQAPYESGEYNWLFTRFSTEELQACLSGTRFAIERVPSAPQIAKSA